MQLITVRLRTLLRCMTGEPTSRKGLPAMCGERGEQKENFGQQGGDDARQGRTRTWGVRRNRCMCGEITEFHASMRRSAETVAVDTIRDIMEDRGPSLHRCTAYQVFRRMEHGHSDTRMEFGPPFYPAANNGGGGHGLLYQGRRFPKSSKFTRSLLRHGRWANNTLDEATNLRERERRLRERTMQKIEKMSDKFRWEVQEIERIQNAVRARQHRIAQANLRSCCAMMIQTTFRGYQARALAREQRGRRLGEMLLRWWRSFKARQSLAAVARFIKGCVERRRESARKRLAASTTLQRAWRRWMLRLNLGRVVLATAAIETVLEDLLVELARRIYLEIKGAVIVKAWRKSKRRMRIAGRKNRNRRSFVTQGGTLSPRRKPNTLRMGGSRSGVTSDPSSSFSPSRRSPSNVTGSRGGSGKGKSSAPVGSPTPAFLSVVSAAAAVSTTAAAAASASGGTGGGGGGGGVADDYRGSSLKRHPRSSTSSRRKMSSEQDASSTRSRREDSAASTAAASTEREAVRGCTEGGSKIPGLSPAPRSRSEGDPGGGSPRSETSCSSDGDSRAELIDGKIEDAVGDVVANGVDNERPSLSEPPGAPFTAARVAGNVVAAPTALPSEVPGEMSLQPRRPSDQRPSKLSEGSRPSRTNPLPSKARASVIGAPAAGNDPATEAARQVAVASSPNGVSQSILREPVTHGETDRAPSSLIPPPGEPVVLSREANPTATGRSSCTDAKFEAVSYQGEGDGGGGGDDGDSGDDGNGEADKLSALVGRNETADGLRKLNIEEYNSDAFESDGEVSLTR